MTNTKITIAKEIDHIKIKSDLDIVAKLIIFCKSNNWRLVVYGGYGLDGHLGVITRSHGDLDVVMYGQSDRQTAQRLLKSFLESQLKDAQIVVKQEPFFLELGVRGKQFSANMYYVETLEDPRKNLYKVRKLDGEVVTNNAKDFPPPVTGKLENLVVEVQDQSAHLADILRKRESDTTLSKHDQDIANIRLSLAI